MKTKTAVCETNLTHYKNEIIRQIKCEQLDYPDYLSYIDIAVENFMRAKGFTKQSYTSSEDLIKWLAAPYEEPILDDIERKYLKTIVLPYLNKGYKVNVQKMPNSLTGYFFIRIRVTSEFNFTHNIDLPPFMAEDHMYDNMKLGVVYWSTDLGIE